MPRSLSADLSQVGTAAEIASGVRSATDMSIFVYHARILAGIEKSIVKLVSRAEIMVGDHQAIRRVYAWLCLDHQKISIIDDKRGTT